MRFIKNVLPIAVIAVFFCSEFSRDNPADMQGSNYHPPKVKILKNPLVGSNIDSVQLLLDAMDPNGTIEAIEWSLDNERYSRLTSINNPALLLSELGPYTVYIKAVDNDGIFSAPESLTLIIKQPPAVVPYTVSVAINDTSIFRIRTAPHGTAITQFEWTTQDGRKDTTFWDSIPLIYRVSDTGLVKIAQRCKDIEGLWSLPETLFVTVKSYHPLMTLDPGDRFVNIESNANFSATGFDTNGAVRSFRWIVARKDSILKDTLINASDSEKTLFSFHFPDTGKYQLWVNAVDDDGMYSAPDVAEISVWKYAVTNPPTVHAMNDTSVRINTSITITATAEDKDGAVKNYYWAVDGSDYTGLTVSGLFSTTFTSPGRHVVYVKARDDDGNYSAEDSTIITVTDGE